jgi:hypothetical protein
LDTTIINVRLGNKVGSLGELTVDHRNEQGQIFAQNRVKYFRLLIKNVGWTTIRDCNGQLVRVTRRVAGAKPAYFDTDRYELGWANYAESGTRDIMRGQSFHMDVATLVLLPGNRSRLVFGGWGRPGMPNTLHEFLESVQGKATYTYDLLIGADNARPRIVPVEVEFDPEQTDLKFIPLNTRFPFWRLLRRLRALWARRKQRSGTPR